MGSTSTNLVKSVLKRILGAMCFNKSFFINKIVYKCHRLSKGDYCGNILGRWKRKEIIQKEWYGLNTRYQFENITLCGVKDFDKYLSQLYGDYMQIPDKFHQTMHCKNIYRR